MTDNGFPIVGQGKEAGGLDWNLEKAQELADAWSVHFPKILFPGNCFSLKKHL